MSDITHIKELGLRLMNCPDFQWSLGMIAFGGWTVISTDPLKFAKWDNGKLNLEYRLMSGLIPDLSRGTTKGCIEHELLPKAFEDEDIHLTEHPHSPNPWRVRSSYWQRSISEAGTKEEALVLALENAPKWTGWVKATDSVLENWTNFNVDLSSAPGETWSVKLLFVEEQTLLVQHYVESVYQEDILTRHKWDIRLRKENP